MVHTSAQVDSRFKKRETVSVKYPLDKKALLRALQYRRGDSFISNTVEWALDRALAEYGLLPGEKDPEAA